MDSKSWFASKTLWVNFIALIATAAGAFGIDLGLTPEVQGQIAVGIMAAVNIVLRFMTKTPIE